MNRESLVADLATIVELSRWAHVHAYSKAGRGLEAEHGTDLSRSEAERLAGPVYDLEIGDHDARVAYQGAVRAVARADVLLASLVEGPQPGLTRLSVFSRPDQMAKVARNAAWRVEHATVRNECRATTIRAGLDRAVRGLSKAMDAGPADGIAHGEMCKTCRIRPKAEHVATDGAVTARRAGECETCARYRARTGHVRDAAKLDGDWLAEAKQAQARRRARGEDYGAA